MSAMFSELWLLGNTVLLEMTCDRLWVWGFFVLFCHKANIFACFSFFRISGLGWVIIVKEKSGKEYTMEHVDLSINDSSVTIVWYGKNWPSLATLSTLDLCGVTPVFMDRSKIPTKNR